MPKIHQKKWNSFYLHKTYVKQVSKNILHFSSESPEIPAKAENHKKYKNIFETCLMKNVKILLVFFSKEINVVLGRSLFSHSQRYCPS